MTPVKVVGEKSEKLRNWTHPHFPIFPRLIRAVAGVVAQAFIRVMNHFPGIAHRHFFHIAVAIAVKCPLNNGDGVATIPLPHLPAEYPHEPSFGLAHAGMHRKCPH
ncbi:MAG: hypothetical protein WEB85_04275 [Dongiaceae bacterium]